MSLLLRGLSFCPKPCRFDTFQLKQDLKDFTRCLRLKEYFFNPSGENDDMEIEPFCKKSSWLPPPNRETELETYIRAVNKDITRT